MSLLYQYGMIGIEKPEFKARKNRLTGKVFMCLWSDLFKEFIWHEVTDKYKNKFMPIK